MEKTLSLLRGGFESSSTKTKEFVSFCKVFKKEFKIELEKIKATNVKISIGHFYLSGYFTDNKNRIFYYLFSDVRNFSFQNNYNILIRNANSCQDFLGGTNKFLKIEKDMFLNNTL